VEKLILPTIALVAFALAALLPWRGGRLLVAFAPAPVLFIFGAGSEWCGGDGCWKATPIVGLVLAFAWLAVTGAGLGARALVMLAWSRGRRDTASL
jgi:hypothetical protein